MLPPIYSCCKSCDRGQPQSDTYRPSFQRSPSSTFKTSHSKKPSLKNGDTIVDVQSLVKLTNNLWSDCNTPWSHISHGAAFENKRPKKNKRPTTSESQKHQEHNERWHKNYIDTVIEKYTSKVHQKKRVVTV
jgi:hypothetical protein